MRKALILLLFITGCTTPPPPAPRTDVSMAVWDRSEPSTAPPMLTRMRETNGQIWFTVRRGNETNDLLSVRVYTNGLRCVITHQSTPALSKYIDLDVSEKNVWTQWKTLRPTIGCRSAIVDYDGNGFPDVRLVETPVKTIMESIHVHFVTNRITPRR